MKKIIFAVVLAILMTGYAFTCFAQKKTDDKKCVMMKDGKMMVKEDGKKTPMTTTMTMTDGTTVNTTGMVTKPDGSTHMLTNGEAVDMDGNIRMKDKDKKGDSKDDKMNK